MNHLKLHEGKKKSALTPPCPDGGCFWRDGDICATDVHTGMYRAALHMSFQSVSAALIWKH